MLVHVADVLDANELAHCRERLAHAEWKDGKRTAGYQSAQVKNNGQLAENDPLAIELGALILDALSRNTTFFAAALPHTIYPPLFNRYTGGEHFGMHIDNAIRYDRRQQPALPVRTDLSATLFFAEPDEYDGGELVIEDTYGSHRVKLPAGHLILYPGSSLHKVTPVTHGARVASFFWLQSLVRSDAQRRQLFELDVAIQSLTARVPDAPELVSLTGVYHNLLRAWSDV
ncbi:MAG TPA: Fe2+-dependent dioxygenase [Dokdonella sp.]|uniref:Fe2+-dependent dioxygenase n=1 Tax=Dokdonella sp. TaxID=2291710 RepID=UPI002D7FCD26|nr:Fe2+-dependent dioxygenase [Dokdonella sp.]HET9032997.1 Fe2+-dependent dioxygenase [Dokdonella sp.]